MSGFGRDAWHALGPLTRNRGFAAALANFDVVEAIGRLEEGITPAQAEAEGTSLARSVDAARGDDRTRASGPGGVGCRSRPGAAGGVCQRRQPVPAAQHDTPARTRPARRVGRRTPAPASASISAAFELPGMTAADGRPLVARAYRAVITPGYAEALGMRLLEGRSTGERRSISWVRWTRGSRPPCRSRASRHWC